MNEEYRAVCSTDQCIGDATKYGSRQSGARMRAHDDQISAETFCQIHNTGRDIRNCVRLTACLHTGIPQSAHQADDI